MSNAQQFLKDNPHIKLDVDIEEEIPVKRNTFDPKTHKVSSTYQMEKVRTRYIDAPKEKVSCKTGDHVYRVLDNRKWIFGCIKCPFARRAFFTTHKFVKGKLINKQTGQNV